MNFTQNFYLKGYDFISDLMFNIAGFLPFLDINKFILFPFLNFSTILTSVLYGTVLSFY